jgi:hypothetical protein
MEKVSTKVVALQKSKALPTVSGDYYKQSIISS